MADRDVRADLEAMFPRLVDTGWVLTSRYCSSYNCVAFVAGDLQRRWEPEKRGGWYWPPDLPLEDFSLANYIRCFETMDFVECNDGLLETGVEKIALFVDGDEFTHVARQLSDGWWSSKLGFYEDISHASNGLLLQGRPIAYGQTLMFMQRPRLTTGPGASGLIAVGD